MKSSGLRNTDQSIPRDLKWGRSFMPKFNMFSIQYIAGVHIVVVPYLTQCNFCLSPLFQSSLMPYIQPGALPGMPPSQSDPSKWFCTREKCRRYSPNGKVIPERTWYRHNPGGRKARYSGLPDEQIHLGKSPRLREVWSPSWRFRITDISEPSFYLFDRKKWK